MTNLETSVAPDNSIIFVEDPSGDNDIPVDSVGNAPIVATSSCIVIETQATVDGETTIRLGGAFDNPEGELAFDAMLETPGRVVAVRGVRLEIYLSLPVKNPMTSIKIWVNERNRPDLITIQAQ
jgi:hypothetical protein